MYGGESAVSRPAGPDRLVVENEIPCSLYPLDMRLETPDDAEPMLSRLIRRRPTL